MRFGPYSKNGSADKNQLSLYHVQYDSGHINRLTYIKTKNNDDDNAADDKDDDENDSSDSIPVDYSPNQKPSAVIQTMYSSNHNGVTVFFDGSESTTDSEKKNDDALSYKWDFGDDANGGIYNVLVSTNGAASYTYKNPGLYEATLTVTNEEGLESSKEFREITVDEDFMRSSDTDFGEATLKVFEWDTNCNNGDDGDNTVIDLCGVLEFCYDEVTDTYGYHQKEYNGGSSYSSSSCHTSVKKGAAPVLRMTAGKTYRLTVRNLSRTPTNIHTHGLHVGKCYFFFVLHPSNPVFVNNGILPPLLLFLCILNLLLKTHHPYLAITLLNQSVLVVVMMLLGSSHPKVVWITSMIYGVTIPVERTGTYCSSFICQVANSIHTRVSFVCLNIACLKAHIDHFPFHITIGWLKKNLFAPFSLSLSFGNMIISCVIT